MNTTTANSMNFLIQRNDDKINAAIPKAMRDMIKEEAGRLNVSESMYIKMALQEKLEREYKKDGVQLELI